LNPEELYFKYEYLAKATLYHMFPSPMSIAKKHRLEFDDLLQYAKTGIWLAVTKYNPEKNCKFSSYCISYVRWHVTERLNRECCIFKVNSNTHDWNNMYEVISIDDKSDESHSLHEIIASDNKVEENVLGRIGEELLLSKLTERQIHIIRMQEKGLSLRKIGKELGMTGENVRYHLKKAQKQLKDYSEVV
jgi:RNA polymerase sigma factor (sigma-70 family)